MSLALSTVSGALIAGGFYYGLSSMIQTRTAQHRADLAVISQRLVEPPPQAATTAPASARIARDGFGTLLKGKWNDSMVAMYGLAREEGKRANAWCRTLLYGGDAGSQGGSNGRP